MTKPQKPIPQSRSSDRGISTEWFHGLQPEEYEAFTTAWRNSTYVLNQLKKHIARQITALETDKEDDYNNPQWPVLRADRNGQLRQLKKIIQLLP
jgi:hypothetical protein